MRRVCLIASCKRDAVKGSYCALHAAQAKRETAGKRPSDRRPAPAARGYDLAWIKVRAAHLKAHPNCQITGCGAAGAIVDHIESVASAPWRRLDPANLQTLCRTHHNRKTGWERRNKLTRGSAR
jgi:5-methylcytosine-specific restriction endonuclease McrA